MAFSVKRAKENGLHNEYINAKIFHNAKPRYSKDNFTTYNVEEVKFKDIDGLSMYLQDNYSDKATIEKVYVDTKDGTKESGFIVKFSSEEYDIVTGKKVFYTNEDWYTVSKVNASDLTVKVIKKKSKA